MDSVAASEAVDPGSTPGSRTNSEIFTSRLLPTRKERFRRSDLWNRCLVRMLGLGLARTELGIDAQLQRRYSYRWTILGKKVAELITERFTPAPPV
jgi:hypothetical protein